MNQLKHKYLISIACVLFITLGAFLSAREAEETFLIKVSKIYTSGPKGVLHNVHLLIEGGRIKKIIQGEELPSGPIKDYSGKCLVPGMVDAHTYLSGYYRLLENTEVITSDLITFAAFDPLSPEVKDALSSGITSVNFVPRNENLVGGISSVFKLSKRIGYLSFLKKEAFLKISFNAEVIREDRAPTSLMGAEAILSKKMSSIQENSEGEREGIFQEEGIRRLLNGSLQPMIAASTFEEINTALMWLNKWNRKGIIVGGEEAYRFSEILKEREIPVLLTPLLFSLPEKIAKNAALLLKQGVKIAFISDMPEGEPLGLRLSALLLYHQGISSEEALKTITILPAQILEEADSIGSIEEGKDADFVVFSGEPLDLSSKIEAVYLNGQLVFTKEK